MTKIFDKIIQTLNEQKVGSVLNEVEITDPKLSKKIDEWAKIKSQMTELEKQLGALRTAIKPHEKELLPIVEEIVKPFKSVKERVVRTDKYIVAITKMGVKDVERPKYKEAFNLALEKVNAQTKRVLQAAFEETKRVSDTTSSYMAEPTKESVILQENVINKIKTLFGNLKRKVAKWVAEIKKLDPVIKDLENLSKGKL